MEKAHFPPSALKAWRTGQVLLEGLHFVFDEHT